MRQQRNKSIFGFVLFMQMVNSKTMIGLHSAALTRAHRARVTQKIALNSQHTPSNNSDKEEPNVLYITFFLSLCTAPIRNYISQNNNTSQNEGRRRWPLSLLAGPSPRQPCS